MQRTFAIIGAADASRCQTIARRLADPEHVLIVVASDAARIADDLRAISPVPVLDSELDSNVIFPGTFARPTP